MNKVMFALFMGGILWAATKSLENGVDLHLVIGLSVLMVFISAELCFDIVSKHLD